jgi:predicted dinucleotide-utilizing enzyme
VEGYFGKLESTIECMPSENPKTSMIAALSAISLLKGFAGKIKIGS